MLLGGYWDWFLVVAILNSETSFNMVEDGYCAESVGRSSDGIAVAVDCTQRLLQGFAYVGLIMQVRYFSIMLLAETLRAATAEERKAVARLFPPSGPGPATPEMIVESISEAGEHAVMSLLTKGRGVSYAEILSDVAAHLKVPGHVGIYHTYDDGTPCFAAIDRLNSLEGKRYSIDQKKMIVFARLQQLERAILSCLLQRLYENATVEGRIEIDKKVAEIIADSDDSGLKGLAGGAAVMALANASGFALYTTAATVLSTLSAGALGFGAYTATSSLISFVIGPVGWLALGAYGVFKLGSPNKKLLLQVVVSCALISQRLSANEA